MNTMTYGIVGGFVTIEGTEDDEIAIAKGEVELLLPYSHARRKLIGFELFEDGTVHLKTAGINETIVASLTCTGQLSEGMMDRLELQDKTEWLDLRISTLQIERILLIRWAFGDGYIASGRASRVAWRR